MKILVVGAGYVGYSYGIALAKKHSVTFLENDEHKIELITKGKAIFNDHYLIEYVKKQNLRVPCYKSSDAAGVNYDVIIIALPTNYDEQANEFDTSAIDDYFGFLSRHHYEGATVIKSTVPIGFTDEACNKYGIDICFSPEFLREGRSLYDLHYPSRVIVGGKGPAKDILIDLFKDITLKSDCQYLGINNSEAEAVKLFSNGYLAMRVAYFNEVDNFCIAKDLSVKSVIDGISLDERIGKGYNNPSFGFGGYCFPKDTKQLVATFGDIPQSLASAIVSSNTKRKDFIADQCRKRGVKKIGVYRLQMKLGSDNFRQSAILDIIENLKDEFEIILYEPTVVEEEFMGHQVINDLEEFKSGSDVILANRKDHELEDCSNKLISRDVYGEN